MEVVSPCLLLELYMLYSSIYKSTQYHHHTFSSLSSSTSITQPTPLFLRFTSFENMIHGSATDHLVISCGAISIPTVAQQRVRFDHLPSLCCPPTPEKYQAIISWSHHSNNVNSNIWCEYSFPLGGTVLPRGTRQQLHLSPISHLHTEVGLS